MHTNFVQNFDAKISDQPNYTKLRGNNYVHLVSFSVVSLFGTRNPCSPGSDSTSEAVVDELYMSELEWRPMLENSDETRHQYGVSDVIFWNI